MNWLVTYHVGTDDEYTVEKTTKEVLRVVETMTRIQETLPDGEAILIRKADYLGKNARKRHLHAVP